MKECKNCGMPMIKNEDFANSDPKSALCKHCFWDEQIKREDKIADDARKDVDYKNLTRPDLF